MAAFCAATGYEPKVFWEMKREETFMIMEALLKMNNPKKGVELG